MYIQNVIVKSIKSDGLSFPLPEGSVVTVGGVTGIVPTTLNVRPATNRIYVAVAGTIDMTSDANKGVTFTEEQIKALGGDFNFVPAVESGGGGGGGETVVFNLVEDELTGDYSFDGGKTFSDVMEAYASGSAIKWTIMGGPVAFVNYSATGTTLEGCELYNVYDYLDELDSSTVKEITFEVYHISGLGISFASGTVTTS